MATQTNPYWPPDIQLQQINLERQQALADALRQQSMQGSPTEVIGGRAIPQGFLAALAPMLRAGIANKAQSNVSQGMGQLADARNKFFTQSADQMFPGGTLGQPSSQPTNQPTPPGVSGSSLSAMGLDPSQATPDQPAPQPQSPAQGGVQLPPQLKAAYVNALRTGNTDAANKLFEMAWQSQMPTDISKMAAAGGMDPRAANAGAVAKANYIAPTRLGEGAYNDPTMGVQGLPTTAPPGFINQRGPNGNWQTVPIQGGVEANRQSAEQIALGKAGATPYSGVDANGNPRPVTSVANVLAPSAPGIGNAAPAPSMPSDQAALDAFNKAGRPDGNTTPWQFDPSAQGNIAPAKQVYAAPPLGTPEYQANQAKAASDRVNSLRASASESPMRINILDNMLDLSTKGVQTGPGSEWQNNIKGLVANTPGIRDTATGKNWQGNVSDYQEFSKFAMQNASRAWQAAGGTGSDAQLDAAVKGNISNKLFPQAVQQIATWAKGGELALQAKANAQDKWMEAQGNNPGAQSSFERSWRNALDPQIYVLRAMPPTQAAQYSANLQKTDPAKYKQLVQKSQQLQAMGGL